MALLGCDEIWAKQSATATTWADVANASTAWTEAATYCPLSTHTRYDSLSSLYDAIDVTYDRA